MFCITWDGIQILTDAWWTCLVSRSPPQYTHFIRLCILSATHVQTECRRGMKIWGAIHKIGSAFIAHPHWVHNFMPYIWYGSSYLLLSYVFLKKSNAFCDLNFKLIMYLPNPVSCWRILFVCKCVCGTMWVCLSADGSFRRVGHRAMYLQLPPLCALFDGEKDGVYF